MTKAVGYLRCSSDGQAGGDSYPRQRESIEAFARAKGFEIVAWYEEAHTGTHELARRPALSRLVDELKGTGAAVVLVENSDRLARDSMVSELILRDLLKLGVVVWEAEGGSDLSVSDGNPVRKMVRQILAVVAEYQKCALVGRMASARERIKSTTGRCGGQWPYGHYEEERWGLYAIRQMVAHARQRGRPKVTRQDMADCLNALGAPTRAAVIVQRQRAGKSRGRRGDKMGPLTWTASSVGSVVRSLRSSRGGAGSGSAGARSGAASPAAPESGRSLRSPSCIALPLLSCEH